MAIINFPTSPTDGQLYTAPNGVEYAYSTSVGAWLLTNNGTGAGSIPAGTIMSFFQAAAPTGWTQLGSQNNKGIRIVSGTGGGTGGTIAFSTLFSPTATYSGSINITSGQVGDTALSTAQLASHSHLVNVNQCGCWPGSSDNDRQTSEAYTTGRTRNTQTEGSNGVHSHSLVGAAAGGNFVSNFDLQYIDMILATKN
jgi:hypothetical protein